MTRALLTVYFAFSTLLAPLLCCCLAQASDTHNAVQVEKACCCRSDSSDTSPPPSEPAHDCTCRATTQAPAVLPDLPRLPKPEFAGVVDALPVVSSADALLASAAGTLPVSPADLFAVSVRTRLSLYCTLLC